jgi:hypothetical protein
MRWTILRVYGTEEDIKAIRKPLEGNNLDHPTRVKYRKLQQEIKERA